MWNSNWQRLTTCARLFSTNVRLEGKRSREPFDKRFPVTGKHGAAFRKGGSPTMEKMLAVHSKFETETVAFTNPTLLKLRHAM